MTTNAQPEAGDPFRIRLRETLGRIRRLPERVLHPLRRRRSRRALRRLGSPASVLFVCHGNICRSPYAEHVFRQRGLASASIRSAGFIGPGRSSPPEALTVAAQRGLDLRAHRSQVLDRELLGRSELVVVMEASQAARIRRQYGRDGPQLVLGDLDPEPIRRRRIRDPIGGSEELFREVYERIDRCVEELVDAVETGSAHRASTQRGVRSRGEEEVSSLGQAGTTG